MATDTIDVLPNRSTATLIVASGDGPTLVTNNDLLNTIFIGDTNAIKPGDPSGVVPLGPNASITVMGQSDLFAVNGNATPVTVSTVTGGLSNFLGITQGMGSLVIPSIRSPNFLTGISGWSIQKSGNAEFNNLTIRGTFFGVDFIINSLGIFIYSGPPALGNLTGSWAPAAGANDGLGNPFKKDLTVYGASGGLISIQNSAGQSTMFMIPSSAIHISLNAFLTTAALNAGLVNERILVSLSSGKESSNDDAAIQLFSESADATIPADIVFEFGGTVIYQFMRASAVLSAPVTATAGTSAAPTLITTDTWHRASGFVNGWVASGGIAGIIYRMTPDNMVEGFIDIQNPVAVGGTSKVFAFAAPYIPTKNFTLDAGWFNAALAPAIFIDSSTGNLDIVGYSVANVEMYAYFKFPLGALP